MTSIDKIRAHQQSLRDNPEITSALDAFFRKLESRPDALIFGCIDARLPLASLGAPHGSSFIDRRVAAYVPEKPEGRSSHAASLEVAIKRGVKDIIVMGHTDCAAIKECLDDHSQMSDTREYLKELIDAKSTRGELEEESVRRSLQNLMTYPVVRAAVAKGEVKLHGWILNIEKALSHPPEAFIYELDKATDKFVPMAPPQREQSVRAR